MGLSLVEAKREAARRQERREQERSGKPYLSPGDSSHLPNSYSLNNSYKSKNRANGPLGLTGKNRHHTLSHLAHLLHKGGASKAVACQLLHIINEKLEPPFTGQEVQGYLERAFQGQESQEKSLAQEVREWVLSSSGVFLSSDVARELGLSSRVAMKNLSKILGRLAEEGLIERSGKRRGEYRIIDRHEEIIDWRNAQPGGGLDLKWPLELEKRFEVMPGSVVVVAGESNAGKTAFLLNLARLNMHRFKTFYFSSSSETNARVLRRRIEAFGDHPDEWAPLTAISRSSDFQDVIRPDGLNLVDYLEIHSDFYEIGGKIAAIAEKLRDGAAVIALQKNPGADFGRGGAMTLDKASVYLTIHRGDVEKGEPHTLKLVKVKYPLVDYASKPIRFRLGGGCRFKRV